MAKCAFLGLGVMGFPMAGRLRAAGHDVSVWNRTRSRSEAWDATYGSGATDKAEDAVADAEFVMMCLGADKDVEAVVDVIDGSLKSGAILIDHTTASPSLARALGSRLKSREVGFLDAPVSGGQSGAEAGALSVMCGGDQDVFAAAEPVMSAYGRTITHIGPVGAGQTAKCVNQICIAGTLQGLSEGIRFAQAAGLDPDALLSAIGGGAAQSWQMDNRLATMFADQFDFGFAIDWMRKDLAIALSEAESMGLDLPNASFVDAAYAQVQDAGGHRQDTSALIRSLPKPSPIKPA